MEYIVTINNETGIIADYRNMSKKEAIKAAKKESGKGCNVFICWSRASDGQKGYLNPDGNHDITGKSW